MQTTIAVLALGALALVASRVAAARANMSPQPQGAPVTPEEQLKN